MGMRVDLIGDTMGGPTGVSDSGKTVKIGAVMRLVVKVNDFAG